MALSGQQNERSDGHAEEVSRLRLAQTELGDRVLAFSLFEGRLQERYERNDLRYDVWRYLVGQD